MAKSERQWLRKRIREEIASGLNEGGIAPLEEGVFEALRALGPVLLTIDVSPARSVVRVRLRKPKKTCRTCGGIGWLIWPEAPADRCECNPELPDTPNGPSRAEIGALKEVFAGRRPEWNAARAAFNRGWLRINNEDKYELTKPGRVLLGLEKP